MKIAFVCGSPKGARSKSAAMLSALRSLLSSAHEITEVYVRNAAITEDMISSVQACDVLLLAFPLYVDSVPGHFLHFLQTYKAPEESSRSLYAIVNCGFYEGNQCKTATMILENWSRRAGLKFKGALGIGTGGMLDLYERFNGQGPFLPVRLALEWLATHIESEESFEFFATQAKIGSWTYKTAAHIGWHKKAKSNGIPIQSLKKKWQADGESLERFRHRK